MNQVREKQKAEAIVRLQLMGVRGDVCRRFEETGTVMLCTTGHYQEISEVVDRFLGSYASDQISLGGSLKLYDMEDGDVYELTLDKFLNGVRLRIENERSFCLTKGGRLDVGEIDAEAADLIIQYALFNDIVYG